MATNLELQSAQRAFLYELLKIRAIIKKSGITVKELDESINRAEAIMDEADVAWVEKKIAQLYS